MPVAINRDLILPETEYFQSDEKKTGICIHHTVGGSAESSFNWWKNDNAMVGTAYLISRNGTIHEVFDPKNWAWQFGLKWPREKKIAFEKRFIGIEIASEGGLTESDGKLYSFDKVLPKTLKPRDEAFDYGKKFHGYRYFDKYEPAQIESLSELINDICEKFNIRKETPDGTYKYYGDLLANFEGIIGHSMIRRDKSDPSPDQSMWDVLTDKCALQFVNYKQETPTPAIPSEIDLDDLFEQNIIQINNMNISAGSMVKGLIMELDRGERNTNIKLKNAFPESHIVNYEFVKGDAGLVYRIAYALGFKTVTDSLLEVRSV